MVVAGYKASCEEARASQYSRLYKSCIVCGIVVVGVAVRSRGMLVGQELMRGFVGAG